MRRSSRNVYLRHEGKKGNTSTRMDGSRPLSFPLVRVFRVEDQEQDRKEVCDLRQFAKSRDAQVLEMEWVNYRAPRRGVIE